MEIFLNHSYWALKTSTSSRRAEDQISSLLTLREGEPVQVRVAHVEFFVEEVVPVLVEATVC